MWIWDRLRAAFAEPKNKHQSWCNIWHNDLPCNCGAG